MLVNLRPEFDIILNIGGVVGQIGFQVNKFVFNLKVNLFQREDI